MKTIVKAYLRFTNFFRKRKLGYIEQKGAVEYLPDGGVQLCGCHVDSLGKAIGFEFTGSRIYIGGYDVGACAVQGNTFSEG